uniref:Uncharacterized protein n=1 Tax=mine drainage metagenome TaxID=410659 RepID=E6QCU0_9ZZZZ
MSIPEMSFSGLGRSLALNVDIGLHLFTVFRVSEKQTVCVM